MWYYIVQFKLTELTFSSSVIGSEKIDNILNQTGPIWKYKLHIFRKLFKLGSNSSNESLSKNILYIKILVYKAMLSLNMKKQNCICLCKVLIKLLCIYWGINILTLGIDKNNGCTFDKINRQNKKQFIHSTISIFYNQ